MATEGVVSIPLGRAGEKVCAVRSHFLEFLDVRTGTIVPLWQLARGEEYGVILTTGGGLYRYRLHDVVRVTGFFLRAPCVAFVSRDNVVSDMVGEKLHLRHAEEILRVLAEKHGCRFGFAMIAPVMEAPRCRYVFYVQPAQSDSAGFLRLANIVEAELCRNFHYRHARRLRQLLPLHVFHVRGNAAAAYRGHLAAKGMKHGAIKFMALRRETDWTSAFEGEFAAEANDIILRGCTDTAS